MAHADLMKLVKSKKRYGTIVADPPWPESGGGKVKRGADKHYALMKLPEIMAMGDSIRAIAADDAHLYLWTTNNYLPQAIEAVKLWGFRYVTCLTWLKTAHGLPTSSGAVPLAKPGLGQYFRGQTEHVVFAVRGKPGYRTREDGKRAQGMTAILAPRGVHSEKPVKLLEWAEQVSPGPYLELFARRRRTGWTVWGNGVPSKE